MEAGGVPVGAVLFDLEAGCPVSVLPRFVTLPFYWSYILPQKTSKTERTGNPQQSCSRSRCRGESRKRKPLLPRLLSLRVWLLTVPLVLFVVRLGPRGPSEVQELSPGPCHVARTAPGQHSLVWFLIMTVMGARSEPGRGGEKVARVGVGSMRPLLFLLGPPSLQPQAPHGCLLSGRLLHMRQEKVPCSLAPLLLRWRTCELPGPGPRSSRVTLWPAMGQVLSARADEAPPHFSRHPCARCRAWQNLSPEVPPWVSDCLHRFRPPQELRAGTSLCSSCEV